MATILVVEDDLDAAATIARILRRDDHEVTVVHTAAQALAEIDRQKPDLITLDIMMPHMDGIELCRRLRARPDTAEIPILMVTAKGTVPDLVDGLDAGADDYIAKPFDIRELSARVRALLRPRRPRGAPPPTLTVGDLTLDSRTAEVYAGNSEGILLTPTEYDLLKYLMEHAGEIISPYRLLNEVWGYPEGAGSPDLVRAHIRNVRLKIEPDPARPIYIQTVRRHGYTIAAAEPQDGAPK
ncbi:MAG: DNA-binding response regulator [Chloroflexi bacterium]|nr:MAG: DNA-binding response regulator [Chloroflexota bacterium]